MKPIIGDVSGTLRAFAQPRSLAEVKVFTLRLSITFLVSATVAWLATPAVARQPSADLPSGAQSLQPDPDAATGSPEPALLTYQIGDRLKVSFYERLAMEDGKWATDKSLSRPSASFYLHPEISGEYTVESDWAVSLPVIGRIVVANRSSVEMEQNLTDVFNKLLRGNSGFVNVAIVDRAPIYVVGPVKQPGVYKYNPGLLPWSAVALAGGLVRGDEDKWSVVEAVRATSRLAADRDRLARAWARYAVLHAELEGRDASAPDALIRLSGATRATELLADEQQKQEPILAARDVRRKALEASVQAARQQVDIDNNRRAPLRASIDQRQNRLARLQVLHQRGGVDNTLLAQAGAELFDAQDRQAGLESSLAADQQRLALAGSTLAQSDADMKTDLNNQLSALQREIDDLTPDAAANSGVIKLMRPTLSVSELAIHFTIVRHEQRRAATETTLLQPGDLLMVQSDQLSSTTGSVSLNYQDYVHAQAH